MYNCLGSNEAAVIWSLAWNEKIAKKQDEQSGISPTLISLQSMSFSWTNKDTITSNFKVLALFGLNLSPLEKSHFSQVHLYVALTIPCLDFTCLAERLLGWEEP